MRLTASPWSAAAASAPGALVGGFAGLEDDAQVGDPLADRDELPAAQDPTPPAAADDTFGAPPAAELGGVVGGGLHAQAAALVVDLDRVASQPVLDPPALFAAAGGGAHLGGQCRVWFAAEEAQHVLGGEGAGGVVEQGRRDGFDRCPAAEEDVGGGLGLVDDPVVAAEPGRFDDRGHRVDPRRVVVQQPGPGSFREGLGEPLRSRQVVDPGEAVAVHLVADAAGVQRLGQGGMPVDPHLTLEREPAGHPDMDQPEPRVEVVAVEVQALVWNGLSSSADGSLGCRLLLVVERGEGLAFVA